MKKRIDPNKTIARELERCGERLVRFSIERMNDDDLNFIYEEVVKILSLRQYFKDIELPSNHYDNYNID